MEREKLKKINVRKVIVCVVMAMVVVVAGLVMYSENVHEIGFIENIKQAIEDMINPNSEVDETNKATVVDVTGITPGDVGNHTCSEYYISKYDETYHWNECKLCGKEYDKVAHSYHDDGWTMGSASNCSNNNVHKYSCSCGYSKSNTEGKALHTEISFFNADSISRTSQCTKCNENYTVEHRCIDSNGAQIGCDNLGTCSVCGHNWTKSDINHFFVLSKDNETFKCYNCNLEIKSLKTEVISIDKTNNIMKLKFSVELPKNTRPVNNTQINGWGAGSTLTVTSTYQDQEDLVVVNYELTINCKNKQFNKGTANVYFYAKQEDKNYSMQVHFRNLTFDEEAPVINPIEEIDSAEWRKNQEFVISGTENYCSSVNVEILDGEKVVYTGTASVTNNNWSITAKPELESSAEGRTFTVIVTDPCENSSTQDVTIAKIDAIAPELAEEKIVLGGDWSKEKKYTFTATDSGIGNVQIAFNDLTKYDVASVDGTTYAREYKFVGDVYEPKEAVVYYKDELGNTSTQTITIGKLDNTKPTIEAATREDKTVTVNAHDRHATEGEGSGIVKYRYMLSRKKLDNPVMTESNSTEIDAVESFAIDDLLPYYYVYLVAIDRAGNVSDVYTIGWESESDVTTVDATGVIAGDVGNHDCSEYYISKYDETYHWNECKICGKVYDKVSHTFVDNGWTRGSANSCYLDNVHKFICSCGYSYTNTTGRKAHDYSSSYWNCDSNEKLKECQLCHDIVADHHCITADGDPIGCDNLGKCSICGHVWSESDNNHVFLDTGEIGERKCTKCDTKIKILNKEIVTIDSINNIVKFKVSILFPSGTKYNSWPTWLGGTFSSGGYANPSITTEEREDGTVITYETTMKCNEKISVRR